MVDQPQVVSQDLQIGDRGPAVRRVFDYLKNYGYLPNQDLSIRYPDWTPAVLALPAEPDVFDEPLESAVRAFQRFYRLTETGVVDEATRAQMAQPRCGVPDDAASPSDDKWAASRLGTILTLWGSSALTYYYDSSGAPPGTSAQDVANAVAIWNNNSGYRVTSTSRGRQQITIQWDWSLDAKTNGDTELRHDNSRYTSALIRLNANTPWTNNPAGALGQIHFLSAVLHEIGHALGLGHSSMQTSKVLQPVMAPGIVRTTTNEPEPKTRFALLPDDRQSLRRVSPGHIFMNPPEATNGGRLAASYAGRIFSTGTTPHGTGFKMYVLGLGNTWSLFAPGAATMMAVTQQNAWCINNLGEIYKGTTSGANWTRVPGQAYMISGMADELWILSWDVRRRTAERGLYRWNSIAGKFDLVPDAVATDLAVTYITNFNMDNSSWNAHHEVWVVNEIKEVYRFRPTASSPGTGVRMPNVPGDGACGISAGADGSIFAYACPLGYAGPVFVYNQQPAVGTELPELGQWIQVRDTAAWDAVAGADGVMYHIGNGGMYYTPRFSL